MKEDTKENMQNPIQIVEFQEHHAQSLADMWNASREEWGGQDGNQTAKQVTSSIRNEGNLKDYVALEGETVVGYCSFKEYEDDEGASYIPLLNVRPEYHGKKIGKKLLLKAMEVAVEQKWPRMDLYTWSSNVKAVPLYKKCGFFWEKENPYIHLMNFMPTVRNTEAIMEYLQDLNWYDDVARELLVEPDGRVEKGFHFYEYLWKNEKETLKVEFCRRGRGLRLIDNKDYLVECYTETNEFPFGKSYPVYYRILNKTDQPLQIELRGRDDKNIRYDFGGIYEILDEKIIEGRFFVGEIQELYPELLTHPSITTDMMINGKKARFKLGILPKFPMNLSFKLPHKESFVGQVEKGYLDMENGFDEEMNVSFELEESPELLWEHSSISLTLQPKEKKSLPVFFRVKKPGFYQKLVNIHVKLPGEELRFQKVLKSFIRGRRGKFYGETDEAYSVVNGSYKLSLKKHENRLSIEDLRKPGRDEISYPKLGIPFTTDFSSKLPEKVYYHIEEESVILRGIFYSEGFPEIRLHSVSELYSDGIVKQHYEVENTASEKTEQDIWVSAALYHPLADSCLSYDHKIIQIAGMEESRPVYYDVNKFTENWIYSAVGTSTWGMVWPKDLKLEQEGHYLKVNENLGNLEAGAFVATKPVYMLYNAVKDWEELRHFAMGNEVQESLEKPELSETFAVRVNNRNPFIFDPLALTVEEIKEDHLRGRISINSRKGSVSPVQISYKDSEKRKKEKIVLDPSREATGDTLEITADLEKTRKTYPREIFFLGKNPIEKTTEISKLQREELRRDQKVYDGKIYRINNGMLSFSCDPDYLNGLFSVTLDGKEYIDSTYPKYVSKSFWNPWAGGISFAPKDYELERILQEKRSAEFTEKMDNKGNRWEGIKVTTEIQGIEKLKGARVHQYFLTLPGVPVMTMHLEVDQRTGRYLEDVTLLNHSYFRLQEDLTENYFAKIDEKGKRVIFKAGNYMMAHNVKEKFLEIGSVTAPQKVSILAPNAEHLVGFTNKDLLEVAAYGIFSAADQTLKSMDPQFMIFTDRNINREALEDLTHIRF